MTPSPRIGYLFSRYPVRSQTFTDNEMLGLEARGWELIVGSIHPPTESFRQPNLTALKAPVLYGPPREVVTELEKAMRREGSFPEEMVKRHETAYGAEFQSATRARNACYFARQFQRLGVSHVHVPFANRALHTALFLKEMTGMTISFTTHGQDFMVDLGSRELLAEMCDAAKFVVAVCDYSRDLLREWCPASRDKIVRVYNGLDPAQFTARALPETHHPLRILSVGRLIEFKGFHHLIAAVALAKRAGVALELHIVGEGPWYDTLARQIRELALEDSVFLRGVLSSDNIREEIHRAHLFALGCIVDSKGASDLLPTVITEAMLGGRAVLSTKIAGVPEMILPEETGLLVEPANPQALADAMRRFDQNRDLLERMGKAGRLRAEEHFSLQVTIPQLETHFQKNPRTAEPLKFSAFGIYDLALPNRKDWLHAEINVLAENNAGLLLSGNAVDFSHALWLPDGMVLEMEWRRREDWRRTLETLRTELSTEVNGEVFLKAARRAVWFCAYLEREPVRLLYAAGTNESLCAWLCHRLVGIPCALVFDEGWNGIFLRRMAADALATSNATDRLEDAPDILLRKSTKASLVTRQTAFRAWLPNDRGV